jgi:hypothetical protein
MVTSTAPGWRSVFWIGVSSGTALAVGVFFTYRPEAPLASRGKSFRELVRDFDYLGFIGLTTGLVLILVGIVYEPQHGSTSPFFLAPLIVGFGLLVATGFQRESSCQTFVVATLIHSRGVSRQEPDSSSLSLAEI